MRVEHVFDCLGWPVKVKQEESLVEQSGNVPLGLLQNLKMPFRPGRRVQSVVD